MSVNYRTTRQETIVSSLLQVQNAVRRYAESGYPGGEDILIGGRLFQSQEWTWVNHVPLTSGLEAGARFPQCL